MKKNVIGFIGHLFSRPRALLILLLKSLHSFVIWIIVLFIIGFMLGDIIIPIIQLFVKDKKEVPHFWSVINSRLLLLLALVPVRIEGRENIPKDRPIIVMPNHQSHFDYLVLFVGLPFRFSYIVKKELFALPLVGRYLRISGFYALDRRAAASAYHTITEVGESIKEGESILIFPEGTRTVNGEVGEFKGGGFKLAFENGVPILPVAINGAFGIMKRATWLINPRKISVKIGKPVYFPKTDEIDPQSYRDAIKKVRDEVVAMHHELEEEKHPKA